jgi:hypothetical protein
MSLKAIELQVAIPRTQMAGKLQDQLQQRGQVVQDHLANEQQKTDEKNRKQVLETTETEKKRLNNDDESQNRNSSHHERHTNKKEKQLKEEITFAKHPYKGNFVDFSG